MTEMRSFLTEPEIEEIKTRVVHELVNSVFVEQREIDKNGNKYAYSVLNFKIENEIKKQVRELMHDEVARIARETIAPRIAEMAEKMTDRFVQQTTEIVNKINWYWSIKD
jgi:hypothetical protein